MIYYIIFISHEIGALYSKEQISWLHIGFLIIEATKSDLILSTAAEAHVNEDLPIPETPVKRRPAKKYVQMADSIHDFESQVIPTIIESDDSSGDGYDFLQ